MGKKDSKTTRRNKERKLEVDHITKLLYYFLRHHPDNISFEKIRGGVVGYYDYGTAEITLDYRKDIIPTLIHEFLHHLYPKWSETKVIKKEREVMSVITPNQCKKIIKELAVCFQNI